MADLKINTATGDLDLDGPRFSLVYDEDYIRQRIDQTLRLVLGEWFRDTTAGTDWFGQILGKTTELAQRAEIRRRLLTVPGVSAVAELNLSFDSRTRVLSAEVTVLKDDGFPVETQFQGVL